MKSQFIKMIFLTLLLLIHSVVMVSVDKQNILVDESTPNITVADNVTVEATTTTVIGMKIVNTTKSYE